MLELPGLNFDEVREAPSDTDHLYERRGDRGEVWLGLCDPNPCRLGSVRIQLPLLREDGSVGEIDVAGGSLLFVYDANPLCNDRDLIPPDKN